MRALQRSSVARFGFFFFTLQVIIAIADSLSRYCVFVFFFVSALSHREPPAEQRQAGKVICAVISLTACGPRSEGKRDERAEGKTTREASPPLRGKKKKEGKRSVRRESGGFLVPKTTAPPLSLVDVCVGAVPPKPWVCLCLSRVSQPLCRS